MKKYQLALQWPASSIDDYDLLIRTENILIERLSRANEVDGHDAGSGEVNIFIRTDDPRRAFGEVKAILGSYDCWGNTRAAYREVIGSEYIVLWPEDLAHFKVA